MTKQQFYREIEGILEISSPTIQGHEVLIDLGQWDSLAIMGVIALADQKLGATFAPKEIAACRSVADLTRLFEPQLEG